MSSRAIVAYAGPRTFSSDAATLRRELERLAQELDRLTRGIQVTKTSALDFLPQAVLSALTPARVGIEQVLPVASGAGDVLLPGLDATMLGRLLAVQRLSAVGAITVRPAQGQTLNGATSLALGLSKGLFYFLATPTGWAF